jgi:hypothetical protein
MRRLLSHRSSTIAVTIAVFVGASTFGAEAAVQPTRSAGMGRVLAASAKTRRSKPKPAHSRSRRHKRHHHKAKKHNHRKHHRRKREQRKAPVAAPTPAAVVVYPSPTSPIGPLLSVSPIVAPVTSSDPEKGSHPEAPAPPPSKPVNTALPVVSGSTTTSQTLTATEGVWTGNPISYTDGWELCNSSGHECQAITGASASSYKLIAADVGRTIRVTVTATNAGGSTPASSAVSQKVKAAASPPPPAPTNTTPPAISGTDTEGDTLKASTGAWTGSPTSYAYQWQACNTSGTSCANILGATAATYTLAASDVGHRLRVTVTAVNAGGSTPASSNATATVTEVASPPPPPQPPVNSALPTIGGATTESQTLTAGKGTWTNSPTSYGYQWQDCNASGTSCSNISAATSSSYTLLAGDVDHTIRVIVTATNAGGSASATSTNTAVITSPVKAPPASPVCTETVSSVSGVASAVSAAGGEAAVCLTGGAYGHLGLSGAHSGSVTVEPVPGSSASLEGVSIASGASGITVHNFTISGGVSLAAGDSHIAIDHNDINGQGAGGDGEGVETLSVNCSAPNAPSYSGCTTTAPDTYLTINGNKIHGYGEGDTEDAIHLNDWEHVTVTANDIYDLEEHGNHTDALQSVFGGHYMTFAYNYEHDNQAQGFFIKDGDASEVTVTENLFLTNNNLGDDEYNVQVFNTTGFTMTDNTVWDGQADILRAEGAAQALTATVNHNVEQNFDVLDEGGPAYTLNENDDIFKEAPFTFTKGAQSKVEANPDFADPTTDDYELATNPNNIGIDWQPSEYVYGPTGD